MPQQSFNCVALDLDGTLLNSQHKVSPETKRVLQLLHTSNIALIIATGRSGGSVHDVARELDLKTEIPLVCVNGTVGKRIPSYGSSVTVAADKVGTEVGISGAFAQSSEKIFYTPVSRVATLKTFALAKRLGFCVQFYANDKIYANPVSALDFEAVEKYSVMTGTKQVLVEDDFAEVLAQGLPSKLLIMCGEQSVATVASLAREELGLTCHLIHGTPSFFVEVLDKKANKGNAIGLKEMCKHLGYDLSKVLAIGDGNNDVEFVSFAGKGIAMKNATDNLKAAADETSPWTNDEDGVAKVLLRYRESGQLVAQ